MRKLVVFGVGDLARLIRTHLDVDSDFEVVAFTVHAAYLLEPTLDGLPVVPFENLTESHPPDDVSMFVAVGYRNINRTRAAIVAETKHAGYGMASYISSKAVLTGDIKIGENTMILDGTIVQHNVHIGDDVMVWSGCHISHDSVIGDHAYLAPRAALAGRVTVEPYAFIGLNASIRDHVTVGAESVVGMGTVILEDTEPGAVIKAGANEPLAIKSHEVGDI